MIQYDPYADEVLRDPHPIYRRLRDEAPAYFVEEYDAWALSRFEDIWQVSADSECFSSARGTLPSQILTREQPVIPILNYVDPPDHTTLRGLFQPLFAPRAVLRLEPFVRELAVEILEDARERGEIDAVQELTIPFATRIAAELIGVPASDMPSMVEWVRRFFQHDPDHGSMTPDGVAAIEEVNTFCTELARERRRAPRKATDAVDAILAYEGKTGRAFSDEEMGMHLGMLVIGGSETIAKGITLSISLLSEFPDQREILIRQPDLVLDAFHESLRYDNPTQFLCRAVAQETELYGQKLRVGQGAMLLYASGNRDDREFDRPDVFDVTRRPQRILSFSVGRHLCLGIHLARLEARVVLEELLSRYPRFEVDFARADRIRTEFIKGFNSLPIQLVA
ncbi:MAG: cytochrome P450 [Deltaproteobacteria bacterium]|jgi:cytochrome P450|nr:cytochrome P450 [Deltaproteobacteria bacterium]MBW2497651.1 cytochrome P450 [Deltaproteobacteria bacterium]